MPDQVTDPSSLKILHFTYSAIGLLGALLLGNILRDSVKRGIYDAGGRGIYLPVSRQRNPGKFWSYIVAYGVVACTFALFGIGFLIVTISDQ